MRNLKLQEILDSPLEKRAPGILNVTLLMVSRGDSKETVIEMAEFLASFKPEVKLAEFPVEYSAITPPPLDPAVQPTNFNTEPRTPIQPPQGVYKVDYKYTGQ